MAYEELHPDEVLGELEVGGDEDVGTAPEEELSGLLPDEPLLEGPLDDTVLDEATAPLEELSGGGLLDDGMPDDDGAALLEGGLELDPDDELGAKLLEGELPLEESGVDEEGVLGVPLDETPADDDGALDDAPLAELLGGPLLDEMPEDDGAPEDDEQGAALELSVPEEPLLEDGRLLEPPEDEEGPLDEPLDGADEDEPLDEDGGPLELDGPLLDELGPEELDGAELLLEGPLLDDGPLDDGADELPEADELGSPLLDEEPLPDDDGPLDDGPLLPDDSHGSCDS